MASWKHDEHLASLLANTIENIVGSEDVVHIRRILDDVCDGILEINRNIDVIRSGSMAEGLRLYGSDCDVMYSVRDVDVLLNDYPLLNRHNPSLLLRSIGARKGYTRLLCLTPELMPREIQNSLCIQEDGYFTLSSDSFLKQFLYITGNEIHGPCIRQLSNFGTEIDAAFCIHLKTWPTEASDWLDRSRSFNWPSENTIGKIINRGCHLMPIGSKTIQNTSEKNPLEWRFSFSVAEKELVYSFNHTQILVYGLFKLWLKEVLTDKTEEDQCMCSYFIKTLIFWMVEETPEDYWRKWNIIFCFQICFERLLQWFDSRNIPNYFIPENNMLEGKCDDEITECMHNNLKRYYKEGWQCILRCSSLSVLRQHLDGVLEKGDVFGLDRRLSLHSINVREETQAEKESCLDSIFFCKMISAQEQYPDLNNRREQFRNAEALKANGNLDRTCSDFIDMMLCRLSGDIGLQLFYNAIKAKLKNVSRHRRINESLKHLYLGCLGDISRGNLSLATVYHILGNEWQSLKYINKFHCLYGKHVLQFSRKKTVMDISDSLDYKTKFCGRNLSRQVKASRAMAYDFEATRTVPVMPRELMLEVEMIPDRSFILCIDPVEYSYFLQFLCSNSLAMNRNLSHQTSRWKKMEMESLDALIALNSKNEHMADNYLLQLMIGLCMQKIDRYDEALKMFVVSYKKKRTLISQQTYVQEMYSVSSPLVYTAMLLRLFLPL